MESGNGDSPNLRTIALKAFIPAKDFGRSKDFYRDVGFTLGFDSGDLAHFHHGEAGFLLQNFCVEAFARNLVMHLLVEDVDAWRERILRRDVPARYGVAVSEVEQRPWGMRDFTLPDPSGVLWRIAQNTD